MHMIGINLFETVEPPLVVITLSELLSGPLDEGRHVTMRIKPAGRKSMTCTKVVDRYSPEHSLVRALAGALEDLEAMQSTPDLQEFGRILEANLEKYAEPF
jgi:hypothetical protein